MSAQSLVVSGEKHTARIAFFEGQTELGGVLIQPPVSFSREALDEEVGADMIMLSETASGEDGTLIKFAVQALAYEGIDYSDRVAVDSQAIEVVTKAAGALVALADATSNSKLFDKFYSTGEVAVADGN